MTNFSEIVEFFQDPANHDAVLGDADAEPTYTESDWALEESVLVAEKIKPEARAARCACALRLHVAPAAAPVC